VATPHQSAVEDVASFLKVESHQLLKTLIYHVEGGEFDGQTVAACVRGNDQLQDIKLTRALAATEVTLASKEQLESVGTVVGYAGPIGLTCPVYIDDSLKDALGLIAGANKKDFHITGLNIQRDLTDVHFIDLRETKAGDDCTKCDGQIALSRGIEVGHIFELGKTYAEPMEVLFQDENGKRAVATMGCYGIGVSRLMAAVVEQRHDEAGIIWPVHLAPFQVSVITLGKKEAAMAASEKVYQELLTAGIEVVWDDRKERPGVKFKDAELIGIPLRVIIGDRGLDNDAIELKTRTGGVAEAALADVCSKAQQMLADISVQQGNS